MLVPDTKPSTEPSEDFEPKTTPRLSGTPRLMGAKSPARIARRSYLQSQTKFMNHHESPKLSGEPWSNPTLWSCFWTWKTGRICKNRPGIPASIHARWCPTKFHPKSCGDEKLKRSVRESFNGRDLAWETLLSHRIFGDLEVKTHTHTPRVISGMFWGVVSFSTQTCAWFVFFGHTKTSQTPQTRSRKSH